MESGDGFGLVLLYHSLKLNLFHIIKLISERDRLNKDLELQHKSVKAVEDELEEMLQRRR